MIPTVVLVGRPNVGKSTLFNRLTKTRDALVADIPGLTRDRHYGLAKFADKRYLLVDTGGFEPLAKDGILHKMAQQTAQAIAEADAIIFVVDGRVGLTAIDEDIARTLRTSQRPIYIAVNKIEGMDTAIRCADFYALGFGDPLGISATHGSGVGTLLEHALNPFSHTPPPEQHSHTKIAIVGRPNVGKSTLINTLLGEERVIAFDQPGTTRDAIHIPFSHSGQEYTLIDTAGLRRKGKVFATIEKFSVIKTLQAIENAHVVVLVLDAQQDIADQDAHIAGFILESGRALVVAVNKWDGLDDYQREQTKIQLMGQFKFLSFARFLYISALKKQGMSSLMQAVNAAYDAATRTLPTPQLTRVLIQSVACQAPPRNGLFRPKLRYAHQGGRNPPITVIHGNGLDHITDAYRRYLEHSFRTVFKLQGTPLRIQFNVTQNPFATENIHSKKPLPNSRMKRRKEKS